MKKKIQEIFVSVKLSMAVLGIMTLGKGKLLINVKQTGMMK